MKNFVAQFYTKPFKEQKKQAQKCVEQSSLGGGEGRGGGYLASCGSNNLVHGPMK
jgi:hypothetical protein